MNSRLQSALCRPGALTGRVHVISTMSGVLSLDDTSKQASDLRNGFVRGVVVNSLRTLHWSDVLGFVTYLGAKETPRCAQIKRDKLRTIPRFSCSRRQSRLALTAISSS